MKTKKESVKNAQVENVNSVINKINAESVSLGAVVRNFISVTETDEFARYMLDTITKQANANITLTVNEIKKRVVTCYPYKDENNKLLKKDNELFVPIEKYTGDIIKKAFYNAVGATKKKEFTPATKEQIKENETKKAEKKAEQAAKVAAKKANAEMLQAFFDEMMKSTEANCWEIVMKYKKQNTETEAA